MVTLDTDCGAKVTPADLDIPFHLDSFGDGKGDGDVF